MNNQRAIVGQARAVLVFGRGEASKAIVCSILATTRRHGRSKRLVVHGRAAFGRPVLDHICQCLLAIVDRISESLGLKRQGFQIELVTPGIASMLDLPISISGYSADAAVVLALLSAGLGIPLCQDLVVTGHVASSEGELRPVEHIAAKLAAAIAEPGVRRFLCPPTNTDASVASLAPEGGDAATQAVEAAKGRLAVTGVRDVCQLLQAAIDEESLVLGALRSGFFGRDASTGLAGDIIDRTIKFLTADHLKSFWRALQVALIDGNAPGARRLLLERCRFHRRRREYPLGLGADLHQLVQSLPPVMRRSKRVLPLLPMGDCLRVAQFARPEDDLDVQMLLAAASGRRFQDGHVQRPLSGVTDGEDAAAKAVGALLEEISAGSLAEMVGLPIDSARAAYALPSVVVDSHELFHEQVESFYLAMLRATTGGAIAASDMLAAEAHALLARTFAEKGGAEGALAEARHGTNGGMRYVLDAMTDQFKVEQQAKRVSQVLKTALDPLDWGARVAFMQAFLQRVGPQLPAEMRSQPPQRFARHYEVILQEYVKSLNKLNRMLQRL